MSVVEEIYRGNDRREILKEDRRVRAPISMRKAILSSSKGLIIEYKRQSPSGFVKNNPMTPLEYGTIVKKYATALSVLSEPDHFHGTLQDAVEMQKIGLPMLMKDFIDRESMIESGYNAGYDSILLIAEFLSERRMEELSRYALSMGMETLIEFNDPTVYERIPEGEHIMVGYNRRNLKTLKIDPVENDALDKMRLRKVRIMESGIDRTNFRDIIKMNYNGFLIGTSVLNDTGFLIELKEEGSNYHDE